MVAGLQPCFAQMKPNTPSSAECLFPEIQKVWAQGQSAPGTDNLTTVRLPGHINQPYRMTLKACAGDCASGAFTASVAITVPAEGRYRVAVDFPVWIDVFDGEKKMEGLMCEHSGCPPIRKLIQYELPAGTYRVALSGKAEGNVTVMVVPVKSSDVTIKHR